MTTKNFLAIDLGASSGRVTLGQWDGTRLAVQELHRFPNIPVRTVDGLHWDALRLWAEIKAGIARYAAQYDAPLSGIGVDTWGVDFALLDRQGHLLGNPYHYRDARTDGVMESVFARVSQKEIFSRTGLQFMQLNTLYQLFSMVQTGDPRLEIADSLLMMPDLFAYWMSGEKACEYTIASTSQMLNCRERNWDTDMVRQLSLPAHILLPPIKPGTVLGELRPALKAETGLRSAVPVIATASHDTASAIAAIPELNARSAYLSSGTWSLMGVEVPEPVVSEQALELNFTNEGGVGGSIRLLKNIMGLWLLQESRRQWDLRGERYDWGKLVSLAESEEPLRCLIDPDAPEFLRPDDMPAAIRSYCRRTGQPIPEDVGAVVRCIFESLAMRYRWTFEGLEILTGRQLEAIHVVGGGSRNALLCQLTANVCQRPVVAGPVEATVMGNLLVQVIASGHLENIQAGRQVVAASTDLKRYNPGGSGAWDEAYGRWQAVTGVR